MVLKNIKIFVLILGILSCNESTSKQQHRSELIAIDAALPYDSEVERFVDTYKKRMTPTMNTVWW